MIWKNFAIASFSTLSITILCIFLFRAAAYKIGLLDKPNTRKRHFGHIPLIGGTAMFIGFCFGSLMLYIPLQDYRGFFVAAGLLMIVGVIDDLCNLDAKIRLVTQFFAAIIAVIWGGVELHNLGNLLFFGNINIHSWGTIVSIVAFVAMINAMNMIDGADGFAGTIAFIQLAFLAGIAVMSHAMIDAQFLFILLICIFAFLLFNFPMPKKIKKLPIHIFMGDAGSTFLGFAIAWFCIKLSQAPSAAVSPPTFLWIIALPLFDVITSAIRRIKKGESPFKADREHFHHILKAASFSPFQCVCLAVIISFTLAVIGLCLANKKIPQPVSFIAYLITLILYMIIIMRAWQTKKILRFYKSKLSNRPS